MIEFVTDIYIYTYVYIYAWGSMDIKLNLKFDDKVRDILIIKVERLDNRVCYPQIITFCHSTWGLMHIKFNFDDRVRAMQMIGVCSTLYEDQYIST